MNGVTHKHRGGPQRGDSCMRRLRGWRDRGGGCSKCSSRNSHCCCTQLPASIHSAQREEARVEGGPLRRQTRTRGGPWGLKGGPQGAPSLPVNGQLSSKRKGLLLDVQLVESVTVNGGPYLLRRQQGREPLDGASLDEGPPLQSRPRMGGVCCSSSSLTPSFFAGLSSFFVACFFCSFVAVSSSRQEKSRKTKAPTTGAATSQTPSVAAAAASQQDSLLQ
ncbi:hypothetical protein Efla_006451 [Eimeria flavescens]